MFGRLTEIFESIQGEGFYVGVRQLFVRFSGCNLDCFYCDTPRSSQNCIDYVSNRTLPSPVSAEYLQKIIDSVKVHSICFTGGEPMLQAEFIASLKKTKPYYLETNMTLPDKAKLLKFCDYVAGDLKVREAVSNYDEVLERTYECFRILRNTRKRKTFCKIVLPEKFDDEDVLNSALELKNYVFGFVLQPVFGSKGLEKLLKLQERMMEFADTRIIPQVHKYLGVR